MTEQPELFTDLFDRLPHGIAVIDRTGEVLFTNDAWRDGAASGLDEVSSLVEGQVLSHLADGMDRPLSATEEYLLEGISRVRQGRSGRFDIHYHLPTADGDRWFLFSANRLAGECVALCRVETTAHDLGHEALVDLAFHDPLTGLPNRSLVMDRIEMALGRTARTGYWTAVMFADLDGFKDVNDQLGHQAGDEVLAEVAQRLQGITRGADTCGRWGGDEFVLVVEVKDADAVEEVARRVLTVIEPPIHLNTPDAVVDLRVSLGVALARSRFPVDEMLRLADEAMYTAKRRGGGLQLVTARQGR